MGKKLISKNHLTPAEIEFEYVVEFKKLIKIRKRFWASFIDVPLLEHGENGGQNYLIRANTGSGLGLFLTCHSHV